MCNYHKVNPIEIQGICFWVNTVDSGLRSWLAVYLLILLLWWDSLFLLSQFTVIRTLLCFPANVLPSLVAWNPPKPTIWAKGKRDINTAHYIYPFKSVYKIGICHCENWLNLPGDLGLYCNPKLNSGCCDHVDRTKSKAESKQDRADGSRKFQNRALMITLCYQSKNLEHSC